MYFKTLGKQKHLSGLFPDKPAWVALREGIFSSSPFSKGEIERIFLYVSELNSCAFCQDMHSRHATPTPNDIKWRALFDYIRQLTLAPAEIRQGDIDTVLSAGWSEKELSSAALLTALVNMANRLADGHGLGRTIG